MDVQQEIKVLKERIYLCNCNVYDWNRINKSEIYDLILKAIENIDLRIKQIEQGNDNPY